MKVYYSLTSPFARKVRMLLALSPLQNVEMILTDPFKDEDIRQANPMGKVPALVDGSLQLADSSLICEYLDYCQLKEGARPFFPRDQADYFFIQKAHVQANGILDAAVATVMETRRSDAERSAFWLARWRRAIELSLQNFPTAHLGPLQAPHIGTIATIAALGYLDFRLPDLIWRDHNGELERFYAQARSLPWVEQTAPPV